MTGVSVADHVRNPLVYLKTRLRQFCIVFHCVLLVCGLFKTLTLRIYFIGVFIFVPAYVQMISPQKEATGEG